nr:bone morphogenetic protein antagonist noggin [Hymenolepis microstoma]
MLISNASELCSSSRKVYQPGIVNMSVHHFTAAFHCLLPLILLISLSVSSVAFNLSNEQPKSSASLFYQRRSNPGSISPASSSTVMSKSSHLTKKETSNPSQSSAFEIDSSQARSMRVMGQPINPNIVSQLHPDVSPRKISKLWRLLGGKDDKYWTSEEPPRVLRQRGVSGMMSDGATHPPGANPIDTNLIRKAQALNMTFRDETGAQYLLTDHQIKIFRNWLIETATCEMDFIWKDLGSLYWPRWIRMGVCLARLGSSCSWPPGMKCQPSGSRVLRLLNWNCEDAAQAETSSNSDQVLTRKVRSPEPSPMNLRYQFQDNQNGRQSRQMYSQQAPSPLWRYYRLGRKKGRRDTSLPLDPAQQEEGRARKAKRLIEKLSVTASGYRCSWQVQKYLISDKCTCSCA